MSRDQRGIPTKRRNLTWRGLPPPSEGLLVRPELLGTLKHLRSAIQLSARVRAYAKDDSDLDPIRV
jgi:hypothetical protein